MRGGTSLRLPKPPRVATRVKWLAPRSGAMVNEIDDAPYIDPFGGRQPPSTLSALYLAAAKGHAAQHRIRKKDYHFHYGLLEPTWSHGVLFCSRATRPTSHCTHPAPSPPPPQAIKKSKKLAKRKTLGRADCSQPVDDGIMDAASFVSRRRGRRGGRVGIGRARVPAFVARGEPAPPRGTGEVPPGSHQGGRQDWQPRGRGDRVAREGERDRCGGHAVLKPPQVPRQKYLKKQQLRDWLHVIASSKNSYELRYYNIHDQDARRTRTERLRNCALSNDRPEGVPSRFKSCIFSCVRLVVAPRPDPSIPSHRRLQSLTYLLRGLLGGGRVHLKLYYCTTSPAAIVLVLVTSGRKPNSSTGMPNSVSFDS